MDCHCCPASGRVTYTATICTSEVKLGELLGRCPSRFSICLLSQRSPSRAEALLPPEVPIPTPGMSYSRLNWNEVLRCPCSLQHSSAARTGARPQVAWWLWHCWNSVSQDRVFSNYLKIPLLLFSSRNTG